MHARARYAFAIAAEMIAAIISVSSSNRKNGLRPEAFSTCTPSVNTRTPSSYHSLRRQFATELKDIPLRDLAHVGGWKDTTTLLTCYQQPDDATQRRALESRRTLKASGLE